MSRKPSIPDINMAPGSVYRILQALKTNVETLTGTVGGPIKQLPQSADTAQIVAKINEIIVRLNAHGQ